MSNQYSLLAIDHALKGGRCFSLKHVQPLRAAKALELHEQMYFVDDTTITKKESEHKRRRSCVWDSEAKSGKVELPERKGHAGDHLDRALVMNHDQGSVGFQGTLYAYTRLDIAGWFCIDPWHRCWNDLKLALQQSSLWAVILEAIVILNHRNGPFGEAAFHPSMRRSVQELSRVSSAENEIFEMLYECIAEVWQQNTDSDFGTRAHMENTWSTLLQASAWRVKGTHVKWGRWCSISDAADTFCHDWHARLAPMFSFGFRQKWWPSWKECPLGSRAGGGRGAAVDPVDDAQSNDVVAAGARESKGVKDSNNVLKELRSTYNNTLHVVTELMSDRMSFRLFQMIRTACAPVRSWLGREMHSIGESNRAPFESYLRWTQSGADDLVVELFAILGDQSQLRKLRMTFDVDELKHPSVELVMKEDDEICMTFYKLLCNVAAQRVANMSMYGHSSPHEFALLLHSDDKIVEAALQSLKRLWVELQKFERHVIEYANAVLKQILSDMIWPSMHTPRWVLACLGDSEWKMTDVIKTKLQLLFGVVGHTKQIEQLFFAYDDDGRMVWKFKNLAKTTRRLLMLRPLTKTICSHLPNTHWLCLTRVAQALSETIGPALCVFHAVLHDFISFAC